MAHHIQAAMAQQQLKGENVTAGAQVHDRESMPEFMGIGVLYARPFGNTLDKMP
jgi:hypothetical protein